MFDEDTPPGQHALDIQVANFAIKLLRLVGEGGNQDACPGDLPYLRP